MERYSVQDAQSHLRELIAEAQQGKTVVILDEHDQEVQLVPVKTPHKRRKSGSARGMFTMSDDFDDPLDDFKAHME